MSVFVLTHNPLIAILARLKNKLLLVISNHAVEKAGNLIFAPKDVYEKVLVEDLKLEGSKHEKTIPKIEP